MTNEVRDALRVVLVGEMGVGKTSLRAVYALGSLPLYLPMDDTFDCKTISIDEVDYNIKVVDTGGGEKYKRLRPLAYNGADVILLCFSVDSKESLDKLSTTYIPEIRHYCPRVPFRLVSCKIDLRSDEDNETIQLHEGAALARGLGFEYCETSAVHNTGVEECFLAAAKEAIHHRALMKRTPASRKCNVL